MLLLTEQRNIVLPRSKKHRAPNGAKKHRAAAGAKKHRAAAEQKTACCCGAKNSVLLPEQKHRARDEQNSPKTRALNCLKP
jgi:hypothetical protein